MVQVLGGKETPNNLEMEDLMGPQQSGTCVWKSFAALLRSHLSFEEFRHLKFLLKQHSFWEYIDTRLPSVEVPGEEYFAFLKSKESFANAIENMHALSLISDHVYQLHISNLSELDQILDEVFQKKINAKALVTTTLCDKNQRLEAKEIYDFQYDLDDSKIKQAIQLPQSKDFNVALLNIDIDHIKESISTVKNECQHLQDQKLHFDTVKLYRAFIQRLPLPEVELNPNNLWQQLGKRNSQEAIGTLIELSELHELFAVSHITLENEPHHAFDPESLVDSYMAVCIVDAIISNTDPDATRMLGINFVPDYTALSSFLGKPIRSFGNAVKDKQRHFYYHIRNPRKRAVLNDLHDYLEKRAITSDAGKTGLFAFEGKYNNKPFEGHTNLFSTTPTEELNPEIYFFDKIWKDESLLQQISQKPIRSKDRFNFITKMKDSPEIVRQFSPVFYYWERLNLQNRCLILNSNNPYYVYSSNTPKVAPGKGVHSWMSVYGENGNHRMFFHQFTGNEIISDKSKTLIEAYATIVDPELKKSLDILENHPALTENDVLMNKTGEMFKDLASIREFLLIGTNKLLQIDRLLAYYSKNLPFLFEKDHQLFFELLCFEKEILSSALKLRPELYSTMKEFFRKGYNLANGTKEFPSMLAFLTFAKRLEDEFHYLQESISDTKWQKSAEQEIHKTSSLNGLVEIKKALSTVSIEEKSLLYTYFIVLSSTEKWVDPSTLSTVLQGIGFLNLNPLLEESILLNRLIETSLNFWEPQLRKLSPKDLTSLCHADPEIAKLVLQKEWVNSFPQWKSTDGSLIINIRTGLVIRNGRLRGAFPKKILNQLPKGIISPGTPIEAVEMNVFEFKDVNGELIRIQTSLKSNSLTSFTRTAKDGITWRLINNPSNEFIPTEPFLRWRSNLEGKECLITAGPETGYRPLYRYKQYGYYSKNKFIIERVPRKIGEETFELLEMKTPPFAWLKSLKNSEIALWGKRGTPQFLELPNLNIQFDATTSVNSEIRWMCRQRPGYFLAKFQHVTPLETIAVNQYILLENEKGEQEIFIPNNDSSSTADKYFRFTYYVSKTLDRVLKGSSESNLFLARLALGSRSPAGYSMARALLRPQKVLDISSSDQAIKFIRSIILEDADQDPRAIALRLYAVYICQLMASSKENPKKVVEEIFTETLWEKILNNLEVYAKVYRRTGIYRLEASIEKMLLMGAAEFSIELFRDERKNEIKSTGCLGPLSSLRLEALVPKSFMDRFFDAVTGSNSGYSVKIPPIYVKKELEERLRKLKSLPDEFNHSFVERNPVLAAFPKIPNELPSDISLTRPRTKMVVLFLYFLPDALLQEESSKKQELRRFLKLSRCDSDVTSQLYRAVLEEICDHPSRYAKDVTAAFVDQSALKILYNLSKKVLPKALEEVCKNLSDKPKKKIIPFVKRTGVRRYKPKISSSYVSNAPSSLQMPVGFPQRALKIEQLQLDNFLIKEHAEKDTRIHDRIFNKLISLFTNKSAQKGLHAREFVRIQKDIRAYKESQYLLFSKDETTTRLNEKKVPELHKNLDRIVKYRRQKELIMRQTLLDRVNSGEFREIPTIQHISYNLSALHSRMTMTDLLIIHGRKEHDQLTNQHPQNSEKLFHAIKEYLDYANKTQKYGRAFNIIEEWSHTVKSDKKNRTQLVKDAYATLRAPICYNTQQHPERQVIENLLDISIRHDQIEAMELLDRGQGKPGLIIQAIPGFGKTSLLMPLYALLKADGNHLCLCLIPDQLLHWITDNLKESLGSIFDVWLRPLKIDAQRELTIQELKEMKDLLNEVRTKKQVLVMGVKSAHCLNIQLDKALVMCAKKGSNEWIHGHERLELLFDIVELLQEKARPIGDESHIWMNTRREVNTPSGELSLLPEEEQLTLVALYDLLLSDPKMRALVKFDFSSEPSSATPFTETVYKEKGKVILTDALLTQLSEFPLDDSPVGKSIFSFMSSLEDEKKAFIRIYLLNQRDDDNFEKACAYVSELKKSSPLCANVICLLAEELETLLPSTLKKKCDESYALDYLLSIPARNGELLKGSEFGNPHETVNFTIQATTKHGISMEVIGKIVKELQDSVRHELPKIFDITKTIGYKRFIDLSPKNKDRDLFRMSDSVIKELTEEINSSKSSQKWFLLHLVIPTIRYYTAKLNSNCYRLGYLFPQMRAFTGTLAENYVYPLHYDVISKKGVDSQTLFTLYSHCMSDVNSADQSNISVIEDESKETLLALVSKLRVKNTPVQLVIDAGGYLNGINGDTLAEEWIDTLGSQSSALQEICTHQNGKPIVYNRLLKERAPLNDSALNPKERFTVLFQPFVTGTDIKQSSDAVAVVTVGVNMPLSLLIQSVWRARKIHIGQKIHFAVSKDTAVMVRKLLGLTDNQELTLDEIILYTFLKEVDTQGGDNIIGMKLQMRAYLQHKIFEVMKTCRANKRSYADALTPELAALFEIMIGKDAQEMYPGLSEQQSSEKVLENEKNNLLSKFKSAWDSSTILQELINLDEVEQELHRFIRPDIVPEYTNSRSGQAGAGLIQEVEVSQEVASEVSVELTREIVSDKIKQFGHTWQRLPWKKSIYPVSIDELPSALHLVRKVGNDVDDFSRSVSRFVSRYPLPGFLASKVSLVANTALNFFKASFKFFFYAQAESFPLSEFFRRSDQPELGEMSDIWDSQLQVSHNVATLKSFGTAEHVAEPFDEHHKLTPYLFLKHNREQNQWQVVLLDQDDAEFFLQRLKSTQEMDVSSDGWTTALYEFDQGVIMRGPGKLLDSEIETSEQASKLIAQAKFYNAYTNFSELQEKELGVWIKEIGCEKMRQFFNKTIIKNRRDAVLLKENMSRFF
ncbi:MAG: DUF3638 domain-containing protein [Parachlamydiaceae bacterium]